MKHRSYSFSRTRSPFTSIRRLCDDGDIFDSGGTEIESFFNNEDAEDIWSFAARGFALLDGSLVVFMVNDQIGDNGTRTMMKTSSRKEI